MRKHVVAATAALVFAGSTIAMAQHFHGPGGRDGRVSERWRPSVEDIEAFADARIAGMKAGLRLNAEQEKNWGAFEQAYRGLAKQRAARFEARRDGERPGDIVQGMQQRADAMVERATGFKQLADAAAPLYQSLDDSQKRRFALLARMLRPQPVGARGHHRGPRHFGPGRHHERGGFEHRRFGEGGMMQEHFRTGSVTGDDQDGDAVELEFARLGRLPAPSAR